MEAWRVFLDGVAASYGVMRSENAQAGGRFLEEDDVRLLHLTVGVRSASRTEDRRQTDDAGRVSGSVTAVDVVGVQDDAGELLRGVVELVRGLDRLGDVGESTMDVRVERHLRTFELST